MNSFGRWLVRLLAGSVLLLPRAIAALVLTLAGRRQRAIAFLPRPGLRPVLGLASGSGLPPALASPSVSGPSPVSGSPRVSGSSPGLGSPPASGSPPAEASVPTHQGDSIPAVRSVVTAALLCVPLGALSLLVALLATLNEIRVILLYWWTDGGTITDSTWGGPSVGGA